MSAFIFWFIKIGPSYSEYSNKRLIKSICGTNFSLAEYHTDKTIERMKHSCTFSPLYFL